jgi:transposase
MMMLFLHHLTKTLDIETPDWRESTIILMDNASYHRSQETKEVVKKLGLKVIYTGPYSYSASPIELMFGSLKVGEINPESQATGKR